MFSPLIDKLISALRVLPGVGPKSAQRMALQLLEHNKEGASRLAEALSQAVAAVDRCRSCRTLSEQELCNICASSKRDRTQLCVVESPADVLAIEHSSTFKGLYFVLLGRLSPIDGIGPKEIGMDVLEEKLNTDVLSEIIIATNPTVEGEATSHYIAELARMKNIKVTRIAHGVPIGGELEYIDGGTLAHAINRRSEI